ncbi:MAG: hypothetical protein ACXWCO_10370 [Caldimonas sp.]
MKAAVLLCAAAALVAAAPARACGVCDEDKIAATYDHAVVQRATSRGRVVVFCEVRGPLDAKRMRVAARRVKGLELASLRTSAEPAALSFALDSARQSPRAAVDSLQALAPRGTQLAIVRVYGNPLMPAENLSRSRR